MGITHLREFPCSISKATGSLVPKTGCPDGIALKDDPQIFGSRQGQIGPALHRLFMLVRGEKFRSVARWIASGVPSNKQLSSSSQDFEIVVVEVMLRSCFFIVVMYIIVYIYI